MHSAKWIVVVVSFFNFGGYLADAVIPFTAKQHLFNPRWPPHAKFHNCQTMLIGGGLGLLSLYILFWTGPLTLQMFCLAAASAGLYFVSMLFAPLFPGTAWQDPEFQKLNPSPLGIYVQKLVSLALCSALTVACIWASFSH